MELIQYFSCSPSNHSSCRMNSKEPFTQKQTTELSVSFLPPGEAKPQRPSLFHLSPVAKLLSTIPCHTLTMAVSGLYVLDMECLGHGDKSKNTTSGPPCSYAITPPKCLLPISLITKRIVKEQLHLNRYK